jgi:hypothetical protein
MVQGPIIRRFVLLNSRQCQLVGAITYTPSSQFLFSNQGRPKDKATKTLALGLQQKIFFIMYKGLYTYKKVSYTYKKGLIQQKQFFNLL